jgi:uncharacterized protein YecT (DUF1311 family)
MLNWILTGLMVLVFLGPSQTERAGDQGSGQGERRKEWNSYFSQLQEFKKIARRSYADEQARQKSGDCPHASSTHEMEMCFEKEVEKTTANYQAFVGAIRSAEALTSPDGAGTGGRGVAPLNPEELVMRFDEVETAWQAFKKPQCLLAYDAYRTGTIAPLMQLNCELRLLRDRMGELDSIYQMTEDH